jgi:hypothetical protein
MNLMCCRFGTPGDVVPQRRVNRCMVCVWYGSGGDKRKRPRSTDQDNNRAGDATEDGGVLLSQLLLEDF